MRASKSLPWWCALVGVGFGVVDTWSLSRWGVEMTVGGQTAAPLVATFLSANFGALGYAIGYLVLARARARADADTIRRQAADLEETRQGAAQNEKLAAIGRLAAGVAHEVRNPLGVIRASASMIRETAGDDDEGRRACQFIVEEIDRLDGLISALLDFSRPVVTRAAEVEVGPIVTRALDLAGRVVGASRAELVHEAASADVRAVVDADLLSQVVLDLVTNAAEALEQPGRIVVRTAAQGSELHIDVADDGPGIADDDVARVFEPFYTTKASGTGLGLAMAARIAEAHAGRLAVVRGAGAGAGGRGACFRLELPLRPAAAHALVAA
jgi:two-component system sensor histidine kinase HydH